MGWLVNPNTFIIIRMTILIVCIITLLFVVLNERLRRAELVKQSVKSETKTIETELAKACEALETCREYALIQSAELLKRNQKILRLESKLGGSLESL